MAPYLYYPKQFQQESELSQMNKRNVQRAVTRGAKLLDKHFKGTDWAKKMNGATLDIASIGSCTLVQLFGGFCDGLRALNIPVGKAMHYGFESTCVIVGERATSIRAVEEYNYLTKCWKVEIASRLIKSGRSLAEFKMFV